MSWAGIANNQCVSLDNLRDAVSTNQFEQKSAIPTGGKQITKAEANNYVYINTAFASYAAKASNQLVVKSNLDPVSFVTVTNYCGVPGFDDGVNVVVPTNAGDKIYCGGRFTTYDGNSCNGIVRLFNDGGIDTTFNVGTGFNVGGGTEIWQILVQPDGKVIVIGEFTSYKGTTYNRIVRLNTDGSVDTGFSIGTGFNNDCQFGKLQADGKVVVCGDFTSYNGTSIGRGLVRLNADGSRDTSFSSGTGVAGTSFPQIWAIDIQSDGKIVCVGGFTSYNGTGRNHICRVNTDGSLDTSFNVGTGISTSFATPMTAVKVLSTGDILAGGAFTSYNGNTAYGVVRINSDGSYDSGFTFRSYDGGTFVQGIYETFDGKYVFAGNFSDYDGQGKNGIIMTNTDGTIYTSFNVGSGLDTIGIGIAQLPSGQFFVSGYISTYYDGVTNYGDNLILLNTNGTGVLGCPYFVNIDYYVPYTMTCSSDYTFAANSATYAVDTNLDVEIGWTGDLGGYIQQTVTIPSSAQCNTVSFNTGGAILCMGENVSTVSVNLDPSSYLSQIYQVGSQYPYSLSPC